MTVAHEMHESLLRCAAAAAAGWSWLCGGAGVRAQVGDTGQDMRLRVAAGCAAAGPGWRSCEMHSNVQCSLWQLVQ
jgi:hypothetical protein